MRFFTLFKSLSVLLLGLGACSKQIATYNPPAAVVAEVVEESSADDTQPNVELMVAVVDTLKRETPIIDGKSQGGDPTALENIYSQIPLFTSEQSTKLSLDEFKQNILFRDTVIDLTLERAHYPAGDGHVTSPFGWRRTRMHNGIDIKAYTGDNLYAVFDGTVRLAKYCSGYGYCVVIRHHNGLETLYAHASKLMVKPNDHVKAGDVVALAGNTGRSTGSHLHYEVRMLGHVIDPNLIIDTKNHTIQPKRLYLTMRSGRIIASNNDDEQQREAEILAAISIKYYVVRKGDVLSRIAQRNQTTVSTLCRLNGISSKSTLRIGQRLIVRDGVRTTTKSPQLTKSTIPSSGGAQYHTVKSGETLSSIARKYGTTITNICNINGISSRSIIRVGQRLKMK